MELHVAPKNSKAREYLGANLPFIGYTFSEESNGSQPETLSIDAVSDNEILLLKKHLADEKTQTQKIQAEKTNLDLTNLNISAENQRLQLAVDNHIHEKMDLRNQIQSLTKTNSEQIEKLNSLQNHAPESTSGTV